MCRHRLPRPLCYSLRIVLQRGRVAAVASLLFAPLETADGSNAKARGCWNLFTIRTLSHRWFCVNSCQLLTPLGINLHKVAYERYCLLATSLSCFYSARRFSNIFLRGRAPLRVTFSDRWKRLTSYRLFSNTIWTTLGNWSPCVVNRLEIKMTGEVRTWDRLFGTPILLTLSFFMQ